MTLSSSYRLSIVANAKMTIHIRREEERALNYITNNRESPITLSPILFQGELTEGELLGLTSRQIFFLPPWWIPTLALIGWVMTVVIRAKWLFIGCRKEIPGDRGVRQMGTMLCWSFERLHHALWFIDLYNLLSSSSALGGSPSYPYIICDNPSRLEDPSRPMY